MDTKALMEVMVVTKFKGQLQGDTSCYHCIITAGDINDNLALELSPMCR
jgi:hypothetical protein